MSENYWQSKLSNPGPKSEAGKETSSRNATKHGCCSTERMILDTETVEGFKSLENAWLQVYQPMETAEIHLVHQLVEADWLLARSIRTLAEVEAELFAAEPNPLNWTEAQHKSLARFLRYRTAHNNTVIKHRKAIEDYRRNRAAEVTRFQVANERTEKMIIAKAKLKTYQEKNQGAPEWGAHLEGMRQRAIALGFIPPIATPPTPQR